MKDYMAPLLCEVRMTGLRIDLFLLENRFLSKGIYILQQNLFWQSPLNPFSAGKFQIKQIFESTLPFKEQIAE